MEKRPVLKLTLSPLDRNLEFAGKLLLAAIWLLTLYALLKLPVTIPIHFNASGQADRYGNKLTLLFLPVLATVIYVGFTYLNRYPHIFNYLTTITAANAEKQYTIATRMLRFLKLAILVIFIIIILFIYLTVIGVTNGLGVWFLPLTFALLLVPTVIGIMQSLRKEPKVTGK